MKTGRADLDARIRVSSIPDDEPTFLIRARDPAGAASVRAYVVASHKLGVPPAVLEQALQQSDRMEKWPARKSVDADHLSADQVKQLEYQFSRRAREYFEGGNWLQDEPVMYAWRVGFDEAAGRARHLKAKARALLLQVREDLAEDSIRSALERCDDALAILGSGE